MPWIRHNGNYPTGYGNTDETLADRLFSAESRREADRIAREDGHDSAEDAVKWLADRSEDGWVG